MSSKGPTQVVLGPNYAVRLRDLRDWHRLAVYCCACRHLATLTPKVVVAQLKRRWPSTADAMDLKALEKHLVCSECGVRDCCSVKVMMVERNYKPRVIQIRPRAFTTPCRNKAGINARFSFAP